MVVLMVVCIGRLGQKQHVIVDVLPYEDDEIRGAGTRE